MGGGSAWIGKHDKGRVRGEREAEADRRIAEEVHKIELGELIGEMERKNEAKEEEFTVFDFIVYARESRSM